MASDWQRWDESVVNSSIDFVTGVDHAFFW